MTTSENAPAGIEPQDSEQIARGGQIEAGLGLLLLVGVLLSAVVIATGGVMYLLADGRSVPDYATFRGEPADMSSIHGIVEEVRNLTPRGVIQFGLLLLIATPIARVVAALGAFAWQRDATYVVICAIVLGSLLYSLLAS